jgi:MoaA/NifB/PqqE/SkfB family radical SAM enzyme
MKPLTEFNNFCVWPYTSLYTMNFGEFKMCCDSQTMGQVQDSSPNETWNNDLWKEVRKAFANNERHGACQKCWSKEDAGLASPRKNTSDPYKFLSLSDQDGAAIALPTHLSIRTGNLCNLKCIMCAPFNSTKWHEDNDLYLKHIDRNQSFFKSIDFFKNNNSLSLLDNAQHISFVGGEPLLSPQHKKIIDYLIQTKRSKKVTLKYFSNVTLIPDWLEECWLSFFKIEFRASIDGIEKVYDYIRYPALWSNVSANLMTISQFSLPRFDFGINFLLMNINCLDLENIFTWRNSTYWKTKPTLRIDYITEPQLFAPHDLPISTQSTAAISFKRIIKNLSQNKIEAENMSDILNQFQSQTKKRPQLNTSLKNYLNDLDLRRKTDATKIFSFLYQEAATDQSL